MLVTQEAQTVHSEKYGGLSGQECTWITILEEFRLDVSLLTRTLFGNFDSNLHSCYDRILASISSLESQTYGVNKQVIFVHANLPEEAEYKLKLSTKVTKSGYI